MVYSSAGLGVTLSSTITLAPTITLAFHLRRLSMADAQLVDLATRYAAAWSSGSPKALAAFYTDGGSLQVNAGAPAQGRAAVQATVAAFMDAFPDMVVRLDSVVPTDEGARFHWIWTGTNTGAGGTGRAVRIMGYEDWTFDTDGRIARSQGHYDDAEYQRQLHALAARADTDV
ncbi:MAG: nuclear transport factor 2 family protein [Gemmatimonadota bacterium]